MKRHQRTLEHIFEEPTRSDIKWNDVVSLIEYLGGVVKQGSGSRVRFILKGESLVVHAPHPQKEINQPTVRDIKRFLSRVGEKP